VAALDTGGERPRLILADTIVLADHSDDAIDAAAKDVCDFVHVTGATVVVMERPDHFFVPAHPNDTPTTVAKRAARSGTALMIADRLGERVRSALLLAGVTVVCRPRGTIASRVYRRAVHGSGVDLDAWLCATVDGWQGRTRLTTVTGPEHERDACVAALLPWAEARAEEAARARKEDPLLERPKRARAQSGTPAKRVLSEDAAERHRERGRAWSARRSVERAAAKLAAGCVGCKGRHRVGCKLYVQRLRGLS
jgi:hypothetical protein